MILQILLFLAFLNPVRAEERTKNIDFEDEIIEGMNKKSLDSLSQIAEQDAGRRRTHLYRKRMDFKHETEETLREVKTWQ